MIPEVVPEQTFLQALENSFHSFSPCIQQSFAHLDTLWILLTSGTTYLYFLQI